jgi:hypothetical protein
VQIRIAGLEEAVARAKLLEGLNPNRAKPTSRPAFPGVAHPVEPKKFPGPVADRQPAPQSRRRLFPALRAAPSDMDKRRFLKEGFETVRAQFEANAKQAAVDEPRIHVDVEMRTGADLRAEIFLDGQSKSRCRIWMGGMHSENSICFAQGQHFSDNSCNEIIYLQQDDNGLCFSATMSMGFGSFEKEFDVKHMTAELMAAYLWDRFASQLR